MIDSHCHLDHEPLLSDLTNVIKRSKEVGIKKLLTISTSYESFDRIKKIIEKDEIIYGTFGIHPHETTTNKITSDIIIKNLNDNKKIIGIGETGLDFYYNHSDKDEQIRLFEEHIKASISSKLPLIIHSRDAEDLTYDILSKYSKKDKLKILMHCFTGTKKFADKLLGLDAFFSASGIITFKKSNDLKETFKSIPLNKILIETDSPYLSPEPLRGKSNEPSNVVLTAKYLSKLKEIEFDDLCEGTTNNFFKLFGKLS